MCIRLRALLEPCCLRPLRGMACWLDAFQTGLLSPSRAGEAEGDLRLPCPLPDSGCPPSSLARSVADACAILDIHSLCSSLLGPVLSPSLSLICFNLLSKTCLQSGLVLEGITLFLAS